MEQLDGRNTLRYVRAPTTASFVSCHTQDEHSLIYSCSTILLWRGKFVHSMETPTSQVNYWMWWCGSTGNWDSTGYPDQFLLHSRASQTYNTCMYSTHQYLTYKMSVLIMTPCNLMINVCDSNLILCLCELQWLAVQWPIRAHTTLTVLEPFPPISVSVWNLLWVVTS